MIEGQSHSEETEMQNQKRNLEIQDFLSWEYELWDREEDCET